MRKALVFMAALALTLGAFLTPAPAFAVQAVPWTCSCMYCPSTPDLQCGLDGQAVSCSDYAYSNC
jgi:hypothetical protein